jgi:hypothetical protein
MARRRLTLRERLNAGSFRARTHARPLYEERLPFEPTSRDLATLWRALRSAQRDYVDATTVGGSATRPERSKRSPPTSPRRTPVARSRSLRSCMSRSACSRPTAAKTRGSTAPSRSGTGSTGRRGSRATTPRSTTTSTSFPSTPSSRIRPDSTPSSAEAPGRGDHDPEARLLVLPDSPRPRRRDPADEDLGWVAVRSRARLFVVVRRPARTRRGSLRPRRRPHDRRPT